MAKTVDVAAGQKIASTWGNEIRDRSFQVFANEPERDAQWTTAPNGAHCVTLDTYTVWLREAGAWVRSGPTTYQSAIVPTLLGTATGTYDVLTLNLPVMPVAGTVTVLAWIEAASDSSGITAHFDLQRLSDAMARQPTGPAASAAGGQYVNGTIIDLWAVPAAGTGSFKTRVFITAGSGTFYASARILATLAVP